MKKLKEAQEAKNQADEAKYLTRLGDSFLENLETLIKKKPKTNIRKWYNYLWIFLCKFTLREPGEMADRYRSITSDKHKNHHHHHHHKSKEEKPKEAKDHKERDREKDRERNRGERRMDHGEGTSKDHHREHHKDHHKDHHHREQHKVFIKKTTTFF